MEVVKILGWSTSRIIGSYATNSGPRYWIISPPPSGVPQKLRLLFSFKRVTHIFFENIVICKSNIRSLKIAVVEGRGLWENITYFQIVNIIGVAFLEVSSINLRMWIFWSLFETHNPPKICTQASLCQYINIVYYAFRFALRNLRCRRWLCHSH